MSTGKKSPLLQGGLIGLASALVTGLLLTVGALGWIERPLWDWRVRLLAAPGRATPDICTIMIDQGSLDDARDLFGFGWPWPRQIYGYILDFCKRAGAKAVIFDMIYTEQSSAGVADDQLFGDAIRRGVPFTVSLPMGDTIGTAERWPEGAVYPLPPADAISGSTSAILKASTLPRASFPIPEVSTNATLLGNVVSAPDDDAVYRRVPPFRVFDNHLVPNLALAAVLACQTNAAIHLSPRAVTLIGHRIPLDRDGNAILRFRGRSQTHTAFNAAAILQSEARLQEGGEPLIDPGLLKDKYVLLGVSAPGLMDLKPVPVGKTYPGVEVHATFLDNFLSGDFMRECPATIVWLAMLLTGILAGITVRRALRSSTVAVAFPVLIALPIAAGFAAYPFGWWLPVAPLMMTALLAMVTAIITNYAVEGRQKRFIKSAFKQYLSPIVIEKLMDNPDRLTLGGEEKVLSIFFSDVQGFTSISEKLSPSELTGLLNEYLTAMTDIIHQTGGTIDKYEGDAIIAFWNAPLDQEDHAVRGVRAALQCQARLSEMREDLNQRYHSNLYVRIGLNTGPVVVGNMGSNQRFDYTFLGDAGNLAARLEGINKQFGTYLLISKNTRQAIGDAFPVREISRVRVVGKAVPITIYEPMLQEQADARREPLATFEAALNSYYQGNFTAAQQQFERIAGDDPVAAIYAKRCSALANNPPPDWDGIWNITEK